MGSASCSDSPSSEQIRIVLEVTLLASVRLVDLDGTAPSGRVDVEFDSVITAIRPAGPVPAGSVDGGGRFLLPGLIDTHIHLGSRHALGAAARAGVTTLIDLGTYPDRLIAEQRREPGAPAIVSAGSAASAPGSSQIVRMGFPTESGVSDPEDADRYLAWRMDNGADVVKIIIEDPDATDVPALDVPTITALVDGAHERGLLTVAHVVTAAAFERGLDAGVDVLTHAPLDRPLPESTIRRMLEAGTFSSPTLIMMRTMARARLGDHAEPAFANALESVRRLHQAGVPIVAGTDANETPIAAVPHGASIHDEIALLQQVGMSGAEALRAATSGAAAAFRLTDRGHVDEGLRADLLLVERDPIADTAAARIPAAVWIGGSAVS